MTPTWLQPSSMQLFYMKCHQTKKRAGRTIWKKKRWTLFFLSGCCCCVDCVSHCLTQQSVKMKFISDPSTFPHFGFIFTFVKVNRPDNFFMFSPASSHWQTVGGTETIFSTESKICVSWGCYTFLPSYSPHSLSMRISSVPLTFSSANLHLLQIWLLILATCLTHISVTTVELQWSLNSLGSFRVFLGAFLFLLKSFHFYFFCACAIEPQL